ncbi:MAG: hypothetical protein P1Q69_19190 [Candidatus Thorarchaeota archaeon]|nr:hypothetical protein [Candidatus Thorarchaeota archaeon]
MKFRILSIPAVLAVMAALVLLFGVGPAIGVGAWLWMGVGVRQAVNSSRTKEFDSALVLHEVDFV